MAAALAVSASACGSQSSDDPVAYVESLRGENDLVHGSLVVPPTATLRDFAATAAAQSYAGLPVASFTSDELGALIKRTGGEAAELVALACGVPGVSVQSLESLLGGRPINLDLPPVDGIDSVPAILDAWNAAKCLGRPLRLTADYQRTVKATLIGHPLVALDAVSAGLVGKEGLLGQDSGASIVAGLQREVAANGCDEVASTEANAVVGLGGLLPSGLRACAAADALSLTRTALLDVLRKAGADKPQVAKLLRANDRLAKEWTTVRETLLTEWPQPVGLGTLDATRDAVELLALAGREPPQWIRSGVQDAANAYSRRELIPSDDQAADLLFLCSVVLDHCPSGVKEQALKAGSQVTLKSARGSDLETARLLEAIATAHAGDVIKCTPSLAREWAEVAPLSLVALAAAQPECVESTGYSEAEFAAKAFDALRGNAPEKAVAYSKMRKYLVPVVLDGVQRDKMLGEWRQFTDRLNAVDSAGYLARARPITFQLVHAELIDALE